MDEAAALALKKQQEADDALLFSDDILGDIPPAEVRERNSFIRYCLTALAISR